MNKTLTTFTVIALIISSWVFLRQLDLNNRILNLEKGRDNLIAKLNRRNSYTGSFINLIREDIDSLSSKFRSLDSKLDRIELMEADINSAQSYADDVMSKVKDLEKEIKGLDSSLDYLESRFKRKDVLRAFD